MKTQKLTFGAKITLATGALGVSLALLAGYAYHTIGSMDAAFSNTAGVTARKLELAGTLSAAEANMAAGQRGAVLFSFMKDPGRITQSDQIFQENSSRFETALAEIKPLLVTERGKELVVEMENRLAAWLPAYRELKLRVDAGDSSGAAKILSEKTTAHYLAMGKDADELVKLTGGILQQERKATAEAYAAAKWITILLMLAGAVAAVISTIIVRSVIGELRQVADEMLDGSRQVAAASGQVASASQSLAQGTSEQAATLEETSSSTAEITSITRKNSENTRTVASLMEVAAGLVGGANHNLEEMVQSMTEINGSSEKISKIIRVIDEIAFQTNILALNAAVEAARAGEAGMGFAVVADEVRNLAHRSAQAAKDTAALIEESIGKSAQGGKKLDQVAQSIRQITHSACKVKVLVDEVDTGSQEQSRGIEQIALAVGQMEQVTQRSAANAEESAAASQELAAQAQSLLAIVSRLRTLAGDSASKDAARPRTNRPPRELEERRTTEDLAALSRSLRPGQRSTPAQVPVLAQSKVEFPLDDQEAQF